MKRAAWAVVGLLGGLAHPGCSGQAPEHARPSPAKDAPSATNTGSQAQGASASPTEACGQEPPLAVRTRTQVSPAGIGLSVINAGPKAVRLASAVALLDARGQALNVEALRLQRACATAETCVTLEPGAELLSPPWLGLVEAGGSAREQNTEAGGPHGSAEQNCGALVRPSEPGSYQLVLRSCECQSEQRVEAGGSAREQNVVVPWPPS